MEAPLVISIILNIFIIIITFYLIFLYIKSSAFKIYPCYNILVLSIILFLDNIFRLIPTEDASLGVQYIQAIILTSFDKLIFLNVLSQVLIRYLGVCHNETYFDNEKKIFFLILFLSLGVSFALGFLFILFGAEYDGDSDNDLEHYGLYYYCKDSEGKKYIDIIFTSFIIISYTFLTILLIKFITRKQGEESLGMINELDYGHHRTTLLVAWLINSLFFFLSYLIIYNILPGDYVDLIYCTSCLLIDLNYTLNKIVTKETMRIFCKKSFEKKYVLVKKTNTVSENVYEEDEDQNKKDDKNTDEFSDD